VSTSQSKSEYTAQRLQRVSRVGSGINGYGRREKYAAWCVLAPNGKVIREHAFGRSRPEGQAQELAEKQAKELTESVGHLW